MRKKVIDLVDKIISNEVNVPISEQISEMGFSYFLYPYLYNEAKQLAYEIDKENYNILHIEQSLLRNIPNYLYLMIAKIAVLELNIERLKDSLEGDTSEQRLNSYLRKLKNKDYLYYVFTEYSSLLPQVEQFISDWKTSTREFLNRLDNDILEIQEKLFEPVSISKVSAIDWGKGDRHQGGRSVCIITFSDKNKIVYKPRPFSTDTIIHDVLSWINYKTNSDYFYQINFIDKEEYGWSEFIKHEQLKNTQDIEIFYEKLGAWLAVLYVLQATDMHYENIIAYHSYPIIIDTETLFQTQLKSTDTYSKKYFDLDKTILKSNIIPAFVEDLPNDFDSSAINVDNEIKMPVKRGLIKNAGKDNMSFTEVDNIHAKEHTNLPKKIDKIELLKFLPNFLEGFKKLYFIFYENKSDFINLIKNYKNLKRRVLLRNTFEYSKLIQASYHTDLMQKKETRQDFFVDLKNNVSKHSELREVANAEIYSILNGEVPMFSSRIGKNEIYYGNKVISTDLYAQTGFELAVETIKSLSGQHYKLQKWLIESTLLIKSKSDYQPNIPVLDKNIILNKDQVLLKCIEIGKNILDYKLFENNKVGWLNVKFSEIPKITLMDTSLYSGLSGMLLLYTYLSKITNDAIFINASKEIYHTLLERVKEESITQIGAFTGLGSVLYSVLHYQETFKEERNYDIISNFINILHENIEVDSYFDMMYGSTGVILIALAAYKSTKLEKSLQLAEKCAYHLINNVNEQEVGVSWGDSKLTGFSHGTSGVIYSFVELYKVTSNEIFLNVALEALKYEDSMFSKKAQNWYDLRKLNGEERRGNQRFSNSWCNGTNGIGLSRINLASVVHTKNILNDINLALNINKLESFGGNHCLCHGDLGNLELLIQANSSKENNDVINTVVNRTLNNFENSNYRHGNKFNITTFDLMTGKAGFSYQLLRIIYPEIVPSVLLLESSKNEDI